MDTGRKVKEQGFTLLELMMVVLIIGLLAAIAIFAYREYTVRSQVAEGVALATSAQVSLAEFYTRSGRWPVGGNTSVGLPQPASISGNYVKSISVQGGGTGQFDLVFGNRANPIIAGAANKCVFSPVTASAGSVRWTAACNFPSRLLPQVYRNP